MLKSKIGTPLAIAILVALAGCAKKEPAADTAKAPEAPPAAAQVPADHPVAQPAAEVDLSGIAKAEGGKTVAEVYAEKDALSGQKVIVRGKVVKTNAGIMGRNWLHVRDGSGADGTNDLTVTTAADLPAVGATVVLTGTLALDQDFGMGYQYPVIVQDAELTVE